MFLTKEFIAMPTLPKLRWLHLTDLHVGKDSESQRIALRSLIDAVISNAGDVPFDIVLLTGDLVYSGREEEFTNFETEIIARLRSTDLCRRAQFAAVPGHHDLTCDIGFPPNWSTLGATRQDQFFNLDIKGK